MGSIIFIIIIVVVAIATTSKQQQQKKSKTKQSDGYAEKQSSYHDVGSSYSRSSSMKNRANSASNSGSYATRKAAEHAKENMKANELKNRPTAQEFREMAGVESSDGAILSAAKMHSFATELSNEFDSKEDLMKPVYDLMITGPDTSIPNERDFVSEATDMLNSYVTEA